MIVCFILFKFAKNWCRTLIYCQVLNFSKFQVIVFLHKYAIVMVDEYILHNVDAYKSLIGNSVKCRSCVRNCKYCWNEHNHCEKREGFKVNQSMSQETCHHWLYLLSSELRRMYSSSLIVSYNIWRARSPLFLFRNSGFLYVVPNTVALFIDQ